MTDRIALDANVLDWLLEPARMSEMNSRRAQERFEPIVTAEVAHEVNQIPEEKAATKAALQQLIRDHFMPVRPTWVPIAGIARFGMAYFATPTTEGFFQNARECGLNKMDALHVTNAHFHKCVAFLTFDERLRNKQERISKLTSLRLDDPAIWLGDIPQ